MSGDIDSRDAGTITSCAMLRTSRPLIQARMLEPKLHHTVEREILKGRGNRSYVGRQSGFKMAANLTSDPRPV